MEIKSLNDYVMDERLSETVTIGHFVFQNGLTVYAITELLSHIHSPTKVMAWKLEEYEFYELVEFNKRVRTGVYASKIRREIIERYFNGIILCAKDCAGKRESFSFSDISHQLPHIIYHNETIEELRSLLKKRGEVTDFETKLPLVAPLGRIYVGNDSRSIWIGTMAAFYGWTVYRINKPTDRIKYTNSFWF